MTIAGFWATRLTAIALLLAALAAGVAVMRRGRRSTSGAIASGHRDGPEPAVPSYATYRANPHAAAVVPTEDP